MNPIDEFISITMPFLFSAATILFGSMVSNYALTLLKINDHADMDLKVKKLASELATQVYIQLGFIFAILSSCVACIAFTIKSPRPILAAIGAFILIIVIPIWFLSWQNLSLKKLKGKEGRWMRITKWGVIAISYVVTLFARYYIVSPPQ